MRPFRHRTEVSLFFVPLLLCGTIVQAADWKPVDPAELAQKTPKIDPNADAEAIFWDIHVEDKLRGGQDLSLELDHYIRIKIFTPRGKEEFATVEIPRAENQIIADVAGRTIKPDGAIVEVKKDAIFDRALVRTKGMKLHGITFVLPDVEVGDIVEYRYREIHDGEMMSHMRLYFQRDIPMWTVAYHVKPLELAWLPYTMRSISFQSHNSAFQQEPDGYFVSTASNVPAFREEPNMPPQDQVKAWVLIYYEENKKIEPDKFWQDLGKQDFARFKPLTKADDLVKRTAAEVTTDATTPEAKVAALDRYCRTKIRNLNSSVSHLTTEQRKAIKNNLSPGDTLKQKAGTSLDIDLLFVAMAGASGFDARVTRVPDRGDKFFTASIPSTYFVENYSAAVKIGDLWAFFDPSTQYLEPGMLRWQEEGQSALISDPKAGFFENTPHSPVDRSTRRHSASFKLHDDGTIDGTVTYTYTGHASVLQKNSYDDMTAAQQEKEWKDELQGRLSTAEISDFHMQNFDDPVKPMIVQHQVSVPGYATRTGKRIILQPAFFQRNVPPRFTENSRNWDVYFHFGWTEDDTVTIELPENWEVDRPAAPQSSSFPPVGAYSATLNVADDGRTLTWRRHFEWGRDKYLLFPVSGYLQIKKAFDLVEDMDNYTISLRPKTAANQEPASAK